MSMDKYGSAVLDWAVKTHRSRGACGQPDALWHVAEGGRGLEDNQALEQFLASVERRAFRMASLAVGNQDDALDIVQEAMMKLATHYGNREATQWPPLFQRILQNAITDHHRRHTQPRWQRWLGIRQDQGSVDQDALNNHPDPKTREPMQQAQQDESMALLERAIQALPLRQQQAFMLRLWEGLSVAETSQAMGCSEGSVKTHYSRAVRALRDKLEGVWP